KERHKRVARVGPLEYWMFSTSAGCSVPRPDHLYGQRILRRDKGVFVAEASRRIEPVKTVSGDTLLLEFSPLRPLPIPGTVLPGFFQTLENQLSHSPTGISKPIPC
ncbi:MAG: hypothetical protein PHP93_01860, partial [Kiritimatiellales bacterium]|nr:hypothetical protein [Kiritimatiellales bacterium]